MTQTPAAVPPIHDWNKQLDGKVAVVDAGGLAELGTHDELVALGGQYAALSAAWERNQHPGVVAS